jgi:hypothetical protein
MAHMHVSDEINIVSSEDEVENEDSDTDSLEFEQ